MAPTYVGDFQLKGADLRRRGLNRIGNMLVPNSNYCKFEVGGHACRLLVVQLALRGAGAGVQGLQHRWSPAPPAASARFAGGRLGAADSFLDWCERGAVLAGAQLQVPQGRGAPGEAGAAAGWTPAFGRCPHLRRSSLASLAFLRPSPTASGLGDPHLRCHAGGAAAAGRALDAQPGARGGRGGRGGGGGGAAAAAGSRAGDGRGLHSGCSPWWQGHSMLPPVAGRRRSRGRGGGPAARPCLP